jgi:AcrR family transcriptional regulator
MRLKARKMDIDRNAGTATAAVIREQRATRTRPALCGALLALLEEKSSFEQVTVREITDRADVGYATFFRRYSDKQALLHDVAAGEIRKLLAMALPILHTVDRRASAQALCAYVWGHRKLWSALLTGGAAATLKEEFIREGQRLSTESSQSWLPGSLGVVFSVSATVEILAWWLKQEKPPSIKRMAEILDVLVARPTANASRFRAS